MQPDGVNLWYFKLRLFDLPELIVWNIKGLGKRVANLLELENLSLWQKLNSFWLRFLKEPRKYSYLSFEIQVKVDSGKIA